MPVASRSTLIDHCFARIPMNIFNKLGEGYESLWKLIIRPERAMYSQSQLGPEVFCLEGRQVKRVDVVLTNPRGLTFYGSHFIPIGLEAYPCVIYLHGNSSNRTEGMQYLGSLIQRGISLMTFDFAACGNSEGQYISLGWYEWEDLAQVVAYLHKKEQVRSIGLWGRSMGAVTALMYLKSDEAIKAAVFDSPFMSLKALIQDLCKRNSKVPMFIFSGLMKIISKTIQDKAQFDLYKLNPVKTHAPFIKTPGFFIAAVDDQLVPPQHTKEVYKAYAGKKHLEVVPGDHNQDRPLKTIDAAIQFLAANLQPSGAQKPKPKPKPSPHQLKTIDIFDQEEIPAGTEQPVEYGEQYQDFEFFPSGEAVQMQHQPQGQNCQKPVPKFSFQNLLGSLNPFSFGGEKQEKAKAEEKQQAKVEVAVKVLDSFQDLRQAILFTFVKQTSEESIRKLSKETSLAQKRSRENRVLDNTSREQLSENLESWGFKP